MKKLGLTLVMAMMAVMLVAGGAWALPSLLDITSISGSDGYYDTGAEAVVLTDTDGNIDNAVAAIILEDAGYADTNTLGIYGYTVDSSGNISMGNTLQIFGGLSSLGDAQTIWFDVANGYAALEKDTDGNLLNPVDIGGTSFGFYLGVKETGNTFYSHASLNSDNADHMLLFDTTDFTTGNYFLTSSNVVIAWEDLIMPGGDGDYNDMVVGVSDVAPAPVPEPGTMALLGIGLLGLAFVGRRKLKIEE